MWFSAFTESFQETVPLATQVKHFILGLSSRPVPEPVFCTNHSASCPFLTLRNEKLVRWARQWLSLSLFYEWGNWGWEGLRGWYTDAQRGADPAQSSSFVNSKTSPREWLSLLSQTDRMSDRSITLWGLLPGLPQPSSVTSDNGITKLRRRWGG